MTVEWREDTERVAQYVNQHSESFAGRWVVEGLERVVAFTEDLAEHDMRYTWNHLTELTKELPAILDSTEGVTGWGPSVKENRVVVRVRPERVDAIRTLLHQSHPDDMRVEPGDWAVAL
jgi:hypothetical protein